MAEMLWFFIQKCVSKKIWILKTSRRSSYQVLGLWDQVLGLWGGERGRKVGRQVGRGVRSSTTTLRSPSLK